MKEAYPDRQFILIIGGDNWLKFPHWYKSEEILQVVQVWVYPRPGYEIEDTSLPENVKIVQAPLYDYSSTDVRNAIREGKDASSMLPTAVWKKIQQEKLYFDL
jgi:nicotinate-nucleotide adenylyltransferase